MSDGPHTPSRDEEMLARLAELDLAAAEKAHGKLMAAEDTAEIAELGRTYQRMARSLRQTLAIKARLARQRDTDHRPDRSPAWTPRHGLARGLTPAVRAHIDAATDAALRYLEREREAADYDAIGEIEICEILEELVGDDDAAFLATPIARLVEKVFVIIDRIYAEARDAPLDPPDPDDSA